LNCFVVVWQSFATKEMARSNRFWSFLFLLLTTWMVLVCCASKKKKASSSPPPPPKEPKEKARKEKTPEKETMEGGTKSASEVEKKMQYLKEKITKNGVVTLNDDNFARFAIDRPRDYHAILMFTATAPQYKCSVCGRAKTIFEDTAKLYNSQYNFSTASAVNRLAFFRIEVDDARGIFGSLGLESVPRFYALPPVTKDSPKMKIESLEIESQSFHQGLSSAVTYLSEATHVKVKNKNLLIFCFLVLICFNFVLRFIFYTIHLW
jgi:hypothetical protein